MPGPGDAKAAGTQLSFCMVVRGEKHLRMRAEEQTWGGQGVEVGRGCLGKVGSKEDRKTPLAQAKSH